jgi:hypothetical protein
MISPVVAWMTAQVRLSDSETNVMADVVARRTGDDATISAQLLRRVLRHATNQVRNMQTPHRRVEPVIDLCWVCRRPLDRECAHTYHALGCPCRDQIDKPGPDLCMEFTGCGEACHESCCPSCGWERIGRPDRRFRDGSRGPIK